MSRINTPSFASSIHAAPGRLRPSRELYRYAILEERMADDSTLVQKVRKVVTIERPAVYDLDALLQARELENATDPDPALCELEELVWERVIGPVLRSRTRYWLTWWDMAFQGRAWRLGRFLRRGWQSPCRRLVDVLSWVPRRVMCLLVARPQCRNGRFGLYVWVGEQGACKSSAALLATVKAAPAEMTSNMPIHDASFRRMYSMAQVWMLRHAAFFGDELGEWTNCQDWFSFPSEFRDWLIELRHHHVQMHATAQSLEQVDVSLRRVAIGVRFPRLVRVPFLGWIIPDTRKHVKRCTWGTKMSGGNWWISGFGSIIVYDEVKPTMLQSYMAKVRTGDPKAKLKVSRWGFLLWRQSVVDKYDSHFVMAEDKIIRPGVDDKEDAGRVSSKARPKSNRQ